MLAFKLAFKNLIGAGLRTWLTVFVLSISFVLIIFYNGMMDGWNLQATNDTIDWEIGQGQYLHENYDKYDPFTLKDAHSKIPDELNNKNNVPILISQGTIFPEGRMFSLLIKGIPIDQEILQIPTGDFQLEEGIIPVIIGKYMAKTAKLKENDYVKLQWRDKGGTFDALDVKVVKVFDCNVPSIDNAQMWLPLSILQEMKGLEGEASIIVCGEESESRKEYTGWVFNDHDALLADIQEMVKSKKSGASVIYLILLLIALLAIFDTQILSIFRRQKEIGTYIAMGMTRRQVVGLFTVEGGTHSILAVLMGAIYGIPLFIYMAKKGIAMPISTEEFGIAMAERMFSTYSPALVVGTILFIVIAATVVSYLPARKISKLNPTDALKGKVQ
ncbi:MAG: FtsX-like permease family protein [Bacteroidetes bacterium]|nr:FtsX-like permease family protein [Bacteroidota bacterium]